MTDAVHPQARTIFDRPYLLLVLTALLWSGNMVAGRFVAGSMPPATVACLRWLVASALVLPFAWTHLRQDWPVLRWHLPIMLVYAVTGLAINNALVYYALGLTEATNASVLQSISPLVIGLWSLILFNDRLTSRQGLGLIVSLAGVLTILSEGELGLLLRLRLNAGDLWLIFATCIYGLYAVLLRKKPAIHALTFLLGTGLLGALLLVPVAMLELWPGGQIKLSGDGMLAMLYICIFPSLVAFVFFNRGVELIGPNRAGVFIHLMPLFGAGLAILFLGERPQPFHAVGLVLILSGVYLAARRGRISQADRAP